VKQVLKASKVFREKLDRKVQLVQRVQQVLRVSKAHRVSKVKLVLQVQLVLELQLAELKGRFLRRPPALTMQLLG
jgi:hypothetical protein